jgi:hypothetical protein
VRWVSGDCWCHSGTVKRGKLSCDGDKKLSDRGPYEHWLTMAYDGFKLIAGSVEVKVAVSVDRKAAVHRVGNYRVRFLFRETWVDARVQSRGHAAAGVAFEQQGERVCGREDDRKDEG